MKTLEMRILTDAIVIHCQRTKKDKEYSKLLYDDLTKCIDYWEEKYKDTNYIANDKFSEHFWKVMAQYFTDGCINALLDRYQGCLTYQEIAEKYDYSKACAEQKVKQSLTKIPKPKIWRALLFEDIFIPRKGVTPGKIVGKDTIYGSTLSSRAITSITRFMNNQSDVFGVELSPTPENIVKYLTDIKMLRGCGARTRQEILKYFKSLGYTEEVSHWEELLAVEIDAPTTTNTKKKAETTSK